MIHLRHWNERRDKKKIANDIENYFHFEIQWRRCRPKWKENQSYESASVPSRSWHLKVLFHFLSFPPYRGVARNSLKEGSNSSRGNFFLHKFQSRGGVQTPFDPSLAISLPLYPKRMKSFRTMAESMEIRSRNLKYIS